MSRQRHEPVWPFLCILACLFILSVTWPRAWQRETPFGAAGPSDRKSRDASPLTATPSPDDQQTASRHRPQLAPFPRVPSLMDSERNPSRGVPRRLSDALKKATEPQIADVAQKLAGRPESFDWPQLRREDSRPATDQAPREPPVSPPAANPPSPQRQAAVEPPSEPTQAPPEHAPQADAAKQWDGFLPEPVALSDRLESLARQQPTRPWAEQTAGQLRLLGSGESEAQPSAALPILNRLDDLSHQADSLAVELAESPLATELRRAQHALARRLALWRQVIPSARPPAETQSPRPEATAGRVDFADLLERLEHYELTGSPSDAASVAEDRLRLVTSSHSRRQQLGRQLESHYRNANMRIVVSGELLNWLMPEREPEWRRVNDVVLGKPVHGESLTFTDVGVQLVPDPKRLRLALEIQGHVSSLTAAASGPARFCNNSESVYFAMKEIEIGTWGLRTQPAQVAVDSNVCLRSMRTSLDPIPLVGLVAHEIARSQHKQSRPDMRREVKQKVASQARRRIDGEAEARLGKLNEKLLERVLQPLADLSLGPAMIDAQTTDQRLTMRLRLAADGQLGSSTPRPRAPADSLASCQIHESALNNAVEQMGFDGGTFTLADVRGRIAEVFNRPEMLEEDSDDPYVKITFASSDALRVRFQEGRVAITLAIAKLSCPPNRWKDFQARAYYRPEIRGRSLELVRDGVVQLIASRRLRGQIPLRAIFSRAFCKERPWRPIPPLLATDPRTDGLAVTQFVIDDGWIGLAFGRGQSSPRPLVAQRRTTVVD